MSSTAQPYRPGSGTEGMGFIDHWCGRCARDQAFRDDPDTGDGCPIVAATFAFAVNDPKYPKEWIADEKGARCTAFTTDPNKPIRCDDTPDLFSAVTETRRTESARFPPPAILSDPHGAVDE